MTKLIAGVRWIFASVQHMFFALFIFCATIFVAALTAKLTLENTIMPNTPDGVKFDASGYMYDSFTQDPRLNIIGTIGGIAGILVIVLGVICIFMPPSNNTTEIYE